MKLYRHINPEVDARIKVRDCWNHHEIFRRPSYWLEHDNSWYAWMGNRWEWREEWPQDRELWDNTTYGYVTKHETPIRHYRWNELDTPIETYKEAGDIEFVLDTGINFRETFGTYYCRGYTHHKSGKTVYGYFKKKSEKQIHNGV